MGPELLDSASPFASIEIAQESIDGWVYGYNCSRPHQSLGMATPATIFRAAPIELVPPIPVAPDPLAPDNVVVPPRPKQTFATAAEELFGSDVHAVEWETV